jgi:4-amino-4-deoxy-L-arabinose transferase-like glycosyltransferase
MRLTQLLGRRLRPNREFLILLTFSLLAFAFKMFLLSQRSLYIDPDEGYYLILARNLIHGNGYGFNGLANVIFPPFLPFAIAFLYFLIHNLQLSLNIITALSGALLGVVAYLIARKKLPVLASFGCFLLVLFSLQLNSFLPVPLRYTHVLYRGSDILNCLLILASVYWTILLLEKDRYRYSVLAGLTLALAYLTRPEGIILWVGLLGLLLLLKLLSRAQVSWKRLACALLVFAVLAFPYIFYLKSVTGKWMLSGKVAASQKYRSALLEVIQKDNWAPFESVHYALNKNSSEMNDLYFGYHRESDEAQVTSAEPLSGRIVSNLSLFWIIPKTLVPLPLLPFLLLGLGSALCNVVKKGSPPDLVLLSLVPYSLVIEALSYPIPRHHLFLVPVAVLYAGQGVVFLSGLLARKSTITQAKVTTLIFSVLFILAVYDQIIYASRSLLNEPGFRAAREIEMTVSRRLKEAGAKVIMSSHPSFAVWASSDWQVLPRASLPRQLVFMKNKHVDFAVLTEGTRVFYHIFDLRRSELPQRPEDPFAIQTIETDEYFDFVRVFKKE